MENITLFSAVSEVIHDENLNNMRAFYRAFPIWNAVRTELSWTHYRLLSRIDVESKRNFYLTQSVSEGWNSRVLERNISSLYFERQLLPETVKDDHALRSSLKDPYIFEFLGLSQDIKHLERSIEMYKDLKKGSEDNPTIGIVLCTEKDETVVKYSVLAENKQLFASKYLLYLPKEDELKQLIEADRIRLLPDENDLSNI